MPTFLTGYVKNASAGSNFGFAGAVQLLLLENQARAEIRDNAIVTAEGSVDVFARTELNSMTSVGTQSKFGKLDKLLTANPLVKRTNEIAEQYDVAAKYANYKQIEEQKDPKAGVGGSFTLYDIDNAAIAAIGDGAIVTADDGITVVSDTEERVIAITQAGGKADKVSAFGAGAFINLNTSSLAFVEDTAVIDANAEDLVIRATGDPRIYNFAGGKANETTVSVGASAGVTNINSVTRAFVGNEKYWPSIFGPTFDDSIGLTFNDVTLTNSPSLDFQHVALTGDPSLTFQPVQFTGDLTFNQIEDAPDTITKTGTTWEAEGFAVGQVIAIEGAGDDLDGGYEIFALSGNTLTLVNDVEFTETATKSGVVVTGSDTITRNSGDWEADGFAIGQSINIEGSADNDGVYEIENISADGKVLTLVEGGRLVSDSESGITITSSDTITRSDSGGSWITNGFLPGQSIEVTSAGTNNGTYLVDEVTDTTLTLSFAETLTTNTASGVTVSGPGTIIRSQGTWYADGYRAGDQIMVSNTNLNDQTFTIAEINGALLILDDSVPIFDEVATAPIVNTDVIVGGGQIDADDVIIEALSGDQIVSLSKAGVSPSSKADTSAASGDSTSAPTGVNNQGGADTTGGGKYGLGVSGAVSVNTVDASTRAYVDGNVAIITDNHVDLFAGSEGARHVTGSPSLTFAGDTIQRDSGSWISDGFRAGDTLRVRGAGESGNNTFFQILAVTDTDVTLEENTLVSETTSDATVEAGPAMRGAPKLTFSRELNDFDTLERDGGNWIAEGFRPGQIIRISDAPDIIEEGTGDNKGDNNGSYEVVAVTTTTLTLGVVVSNPFNAIQSGVVFDVLERLRDDGIVSAAGLEVLKDQEIAANSGVRILAEDDGLPIKILAGAGSITRTAGDNSSGLAGSYAQNTDFRLHPGLRSRRDDDGRRRLERQRTDTWQHHIDCCQRRKSRQGGHRGPSDHQQDRPRHPGISPKHRRRRSGQRPRQRGRLLLDLYLFGCGHVGRQSGIRRLDGTQFHRKPGVGLFGQLRCRCHEQPRGRCQQRRRHPRDHRGRCGRQTRDAGGRFVFHQYDQQLDRSIHPRPENRRGSARQHG